MGAGGAFPVMIAPEPGDAFTVARCICGRSSVVLGSVWPEITLAPEQVVARLRELFAHARGCTTSTRIRPVPQPGRNQHL